MNTSHVTVAGILYSDRAAHEHKGLDRMALRKKAESDVLRILLTRELSCAALWESQAR